MDTKIIENQIHEILGFLYKDYFLGNAELVRNTLDLKLDNSTPSIFIRGNFKGFEDLKDCIKKSIAEYFYLFRLSITFCFQDGLYRELSYVKPMSKYSILDKEFLNQIKNDVYEFMNSNKNIYKIHAFFSNVIVTEALAPVKEIIKNEDLIIYISETEDSIRAIKRIKSISHDRGILFYIMEEKEYLIEIKEIF
jgi:hypothetical protein